MMIIYLIAAVFLISGNVEAFNMAKQTTRARASLKMSTNIFDISSLLTSELFSSPSARCSLFTIVRCIAHTTRISPRSVLAMCDLEHSNFCFIAKLEIISLLFNLT